MPIYDLACTKCEKVLLDEYVPVADVLPKCCGLAMRKQAVNAIHPGFPKGGLTLTNVDVKPVHFETRNQLRDYKRKHNLQLGAMPYD
jgi:hypothetical protein